MLITWDAVDEDNDCGGPDHEDCAYSRAYPNAVVRHPDLGLLKPEEFCPNKAEKSLEFLARQEAERSEKDEVQTLLIKLEENVTELLTFPFPRQWKTGDMRQWFSTGFR